MSDHCPDDYDVFDPLLYAWDHLGREVPGPCVGEQHDVTWTALLPPRGRVEMIDFGDPQVCWSIPLRRKGVLRSHTAPIMAL